MSVLRALKVFLFRFFRVLYMILYISGLDKCKTEALERRIGRKGILDFEGDAMKALQVQISLSSTYFRSLIADNAVAG